MLKRGLLVFSFILVGGYLLFQVGYFATSPPSFCATCHYITPYTTSWQSSPHNGVQCLECHQPRGELGKFHAKARGLNYTLQHFSGNYTIPTRALIPEGNCIACHLGDRRNFSTTAKKLTNTDKINHYDSIKKGESCLTCHRETGHATDILLTSDFQKKWK